MTPSSFENHCNIASHDAVERKEKKILERPRSDPVQMAYARKFKRPDTEYQVPGCNVSWNSSCPGFVKGDLGKDLSPYGREVRAPGREPIAFEVGTISSAAVADALTTTSSASEGN